MLSAVANEEVCKKDHGINVDTHGRASAFVQDSSALISLPEVCIKLHDILDNPSHTQKEVAEIIVCDPALTARLLRIVNSAYYGLSRPVSNISHALGIVGEEELNNLVIVTSIINSLPAFADRTQFNLFWRSSMFSAVLAGTLATDYLTAREDTQAFFISGLLLNIGKMMMFHHEPELLGMVNSGMAETGLPDFAVEQKILGFDHATVGAVMTETWNFDPVVTANIAGHHGPDPETRDWRQAIMFIAGYYSDHLDFSNARNIDFSAITLPHPGLLDKLGMEDVYAFHGLLKQSFMDFLMAFELFFGDVS